MSKELSMLLKLMRKKLFIGIIAATVALVSIASIILAQHQHGGSDCNASLYSRTLQGITEVVNATEELVAADNLDEAFIMLDSLDRQVATVKALCSGLLFRSESEGLQAAIGPVHFGDGVYRARVISNGDAAVQIIPMGTSPADMNCDNAELLFDISAGQAIAPNGAEDVFSPVSCEAMIEVSATEPWVLAFEVLSGGEHHSG